MAARRQAVLGGHLSGIVGLDLGFKWAGIEIVSAKCVSAAPTVASAAPPEMSSIGMNFAMFYCSMPQPTTN